MTISGWKEKYREILKEFGFAQKKDVESAKRLNSLLKKRFPIKHLKRLVEEKSVFVIGAGPSLSSSLHVLKKFNHITTIVADGALKALVERNIQPDIVVTDLDGDIESLKKVGKTDAIFVVHAHGDNMDKLELVLEFKNCIGTTESNSFGKIYNFGGFTDGDRCVFLANHFRAKKIILLGMDFGTRIGKYSKIDIADKNLKIRKLNRGKKLLEWLASKNHSEFYTCSTSIKGFKKIAYKELRKVLF
jgi:hypothetical protein